MRTFIPRFFSIDAREAEFSRRGFSCSSAEKRERLELAGKTFLHGYHAALAEDDLPALAQQLDHVGKKYQGFAYEGAAMALALLDGLTPGGDRFLRFAVGEGKRHIYMLHVGAGWAMARLPWLRWRPEAAMRKYHPVLRWLAMDGYGFHEGYFHWQLRITARRVPARLSPTARHIFYQGLGRSLWFVYGADSDAIAATVAEFDAPYQSDLWSGVGLACTYAGGMDTAEINTLIHHAAEHRAALAQGAAFAAKARQLAGNLAAHTEAACALLCGMSTADAALLCDQTFQQLDDRHECAYQQWRELLQHHLRSSTESSEILKREKSHESICELVPPKPY
jgi:hypothetical protein